MCDPHAVLFRLENVKRYAYIFIVVTKLAVTTYLLTELPVEDTVGPTR